MSATNRVHHATILSIVAILISSFSLYESHMQRISATTDELSIIASRPMLDERICVDPRQFHSPINIVSVPFQIVISNIGASTVSIVDYNIRTSTIENKEIYYSELNGGFIAADSNERLILPITIEPGKSFKARLIVGVNFGDKAASILKQQFEEKHVVPVSILSNILAQNSIDFFDNEVVPIRSGDRVVGWQMKSFEKEQLFYITLKTARNNEFHGIISWYNKLTASAS